MIYTVKYLLFLVKDFVFLVKIWGRLKYGTGSTEHETRNEFREKID